jgi:hypothetical protein
MSQYRIVCADIQPVNAPRPHQHIVAVGVDINNDGIADQQHNLELVIDNIRDNKVIYYTIGSFTGKRANVEVAHCPACFHEIIKTKPDDTRDNNLEQIRTCNWRSS